MFKRPQAGETDEDLLRQQEEFLASNQPPPVKLIKMSPKNTSSSSAASTTASVSAEGDVSSMLQQQAKKDVVALGELPGQFSHTSTAPPKQPRATNKQKQQKQQRMTEDDIEVDPEGALDKQETHLTTMLTDIVEREFQGSVPEMPASFPVSRGFPQIINCDVGGQASKASSGKKKSIFAQQFARMTPADYGVNSLPAFNCTYTKSDAFDNASAFKASPLASTVHERNPHLSPSSSSIDPTAAEPSPSPFQRGVLVSGSGVDPAKAEIVQAEIHEDNVKLLSQYSPEEILKQREELCRNIDPSLRSFLEQRMKKGASSPSSSPLIPSPGDKPTHHTTSTGKMPLKSHNTSNLSGLPIKPKSGWLNMDKIEVKKLEWMKKDLPLPGKKAAAGKAVRFDFDGHLIAGDEEVPVHLGLHHHGEEPERAGYSLQELFTLARSSNLQQRTIALNTLAKLIQNARAGEFAEKTSVAVIPALLDSGIVFILRWALDDSTENPLVAAVACLHSLLVSEQDEAGRDEVFSWHLGHQVAALAPEEKEVEDQEGVDAPEETKKTDADLVKEDLVKGLLRMTLLDRLRYLLTKWRPAASVVTHILNILIRIARHSMEAAYKICECHGLLECIVTEFLPASWQAVDAGGSIPRAYGYPVPAAVKLLRVIATSGRHIAHGLDTKHDIISKLSAYIKLSPSGLNLPAPAAEALYIESLRTWRVFLSYGLGAHVYTQNSQTILWRVASLTSLDQSTSSASQHQDVALISALESATHLAAVVTETARNKASNFALPELTWSEVQGSEGLIGTMEAGMERYLGLFVQHYFDQQYPLSCTAASVDYIATCLSHMDKLPEGCSQEKLEQLERWAERFLIPLVTSRAWGLALRRMREQSLLLYPGPVKQPEQPANLPSGGSTLGPNAVPVPFLSAEGSIQFVLAIVRLLWQVARLHKGLLEKLLLPVLQHEELLLYLRKLCQLKKSDTATNPFAKFENHVLFYVLHMAKIASSHVDCQLYHQVALCVMVQLQQGEEYIAHFLLSAVLFNPDFIRDLQEETPVFSDQLQLSEPSTPLTSATRQSFTASKEQLRGDLITYITAVRTTYLTALGSLTQNLFKAKLRLENPLEADSMLTGAVNQSLVPMDWIFLPILELYAKTTAPGYRGSSSVSAATVSQVAHTLRWVYLLEEYRPHTSVLSAVPLALKLSRLLCTFLAGGDLFMNRGVHMYLSGLLKLYCKPVHLDRLELSITIPGIASFYDLYILLLEQYEAVSFGDSLFACYVMLPMQQKHDVLFRKAVWGEKDAVLRSMFLPVKELVLPLSRFLEPEETNIELLRLYMQKLLTGGASIRWCPLLYLVAVHHTNRFLYTHDNTHSKLKAVMMQQVLKSNNQLLRKHMVYYKKACVEAEHSMELYETLPPHRQQWIDSLTV